MSSNHKVLIINGSPRKKRTESVLKKLQNALETEEIEVEIIYLKDYDIKTCRGCEICITRGECVIKDDIERLIQKMIEAEGLVLASPVYMRHITGNLKNFIDRTCRWFHRPKLVGKVFMPVVTTAGSALKETLDYLDQVAYQWGMVSVKGIGRNIRTLKNPLKKSDYMPFVKTIKNGKRYHKPSLRALLSYQVQRVLAANVLTIDKEFWERNGWSNTIYFYPCKINPIKRIVATLLYMIMKNKVKVVPNEPDEPN